MPFLFPSRISAITTALALSTLAALPPGARGEDNQSASDALLHAGVSAYANSPSSSPLMQGSACKSLPTQWQGVWKGSVRVNEPDLVKETPLAAQRKPLLNGNAARMSLKLGNDDGDMPIPELTVTDLGGGNDPSPDIIFFHSGTNGHLWVLPGAHIFERGVAGTGDVSIGGNVFIGDGVHVGRPSMGTPEDQRSMNQGSSRIEYNNSGITFGGATTFNDRYFKADERLQVNNGTTITAGRVDLDAAKMYPNNQTIEVSGGSNTGFIIGRPLRGGDPDNSSAAGASNLPQAMLKDAHPARSTTVMVAPGVFDQRTLSPVQTPEGRFIGYREMVARYSALAPDKMLVQISVSNPGQNASHGFSMSGYLNKEQP